jgi:lysophospholipase L1-like esterase
MKNYARLIIIITSWLISITASEGFLRVFAPLPDPYEALKTPQHFIASQFPPNLRLSIEAEEGLPGIAGKNVFTTNNMGFRGDYLASPKPQDEFRIFLVGGSTAECLTVDDSQAINTVLQNELARNIPVGLTAKVYNAGKSGDRSYDHIAMIVHRLVHLEPDMIVVFSGFNDLNASMKNADYLHYRHNGYERRLTAPALVMMLATEFQLGRRAQSVIRSLTGKTDRQVFEEIPVKTNYREKVKVRLSVPVSSETPRTDLPAYRRNLTTIEGVARSHGIRLIFMTQPSSWNSSIDPSIRNWHWMTYRAGKTYSEDSMDAALTLVNGVMLDVSKERGIPVLDLARSLPKSTEFFIDDVHFTAKGAQEIGVQLASLILGKGLVTQDDKRRWNVAVSSGR